MRDEAYFMDGDEMEEGDLSNMDSDDADKEDDDLDEDKEDDETSGDEEDETF